MYVVGVVGKGHAKVAGVWGVGVRVYVCVCMCVYVCVGKCVRG